LFDERLGPGCDQENAVTQSPERIAEYVRLEQIPFPILVDADRAVSRLYGAYNRISFEGVNLPHNAVFGIDAAGVVRFVHVSQRSSDMPAEPLVRDALAVTVGPEPAG
jgi:peroxiredoxin